MAINDTNSFSTSLEWKEKFQLPSLPPLSISLTAGTDIPPPAPEPDSPALPLPLPPTPSSLRQSPAERPINPLSLHPTTPSDLMPGAFPLSPSPPLERQPTFSWVPGSITTSPPVASTTHTPAPASPISPPSTATKRPSSVRRFLSLRSLNISYNNNNSNNKKNSPTTASPSSPLSSSPSPVSQQQKRPGTPASGSESIGSRPPLRKKKSASWFRRRSSMGFDELVSANGNGGGMDQGVVIEEVENRRPVQEGEMLGEGEALERMRSRSPPPRLPELENLGTSLNGGSLGAEEMFGSIR